MRKSLWVAYAVALGLATAGTAGSQAADTDPRVAAAKAAYEAQNYVEAQRLWLPLAEEGLAEAQFELGLSYVTGSGTCRSEALGLEWEMKAANQGHARAQLEVGRAYSFGLGVAPNKDDGIVWLTRAAETGLAAAQDLLGYLYRRDKDYAKAIPWLQKAADQGDISAINELGTMYLDGEGVAKDEVKGFNLILAAAEKGDAAKKGDTEELYLLSELYEQGRGVKADYVQAYKWKVLAFTSGYNKRASFSGDIDRLKAKMTAAEVAQAETLVEAARPVYPINLPPVPGPRGPAKPVCQR